MAALTGEKPKDTYGNLLQVPNANNGVDTTLRNVQDGKGNNLPIQVSNTDIKFTTTPTINGNPLATLEDIPDPSGSVAPHKATHATGGSDALTPSDIGAAHRTQAQTFQGGQRGAIITLTEAATITPDFSMGNYFDLTLSATRVLANPSNLVPGQSGWIRIRGSFVLTYGSYWKFPAAAAPTLTADTILVYNVVSTTEIWAYGASDFR